MLLASGSVRTVANKVRSISIHDLSKSNSLAWQAQPEYLYSIYPPYRQYE